MELYHNICNSLPQQVDINRQNIAKLYNTVISNHVVASLSPNKWVEYHNEGNNGVKYVQQIEIYDITDMGLPIIVPLSRDEYSYDLFRFINFIESKNGLVNVYARAPIPGYVDVKIYYSKSIKEMVE